MGAMEFGLLGPLEVRCGGRTAQVQRGNQRALLATLLLRANHTVTVSEIAETLWGAMPPPSAQVTIRNYVKRLRQALGEADRARISAQPRGYLIRVSDGELDVSRFEVLLGAARTSARSGFWAKAADQAHEALSLWRGEPLADVESDTLAQREIPRLAEMQLQALEVRISAELHIGRHDEVTVELQRLSRAHPLREQLHALLMLALYRRGQQAEALAVYQQARRVLAEELGTVPGAELRKLHEQILAADPALDAPVPAADASGDPGSRMPRELPAAPAHFVGRAGELAALDSILDQAGHKAPGTVIISAISGMAGVGKTALAVHWAHQVAKRFPDGQLYVNLRGFDPSGVPVAPSEAIRGFLDALGVTADRIPPGLDAQAGLYRTLLADRQMLIVLDNAGNDQQVRPLLPASPSCLVIVTSRNQLTGLAADEGARLLTIDGLTEAESREMLAARLGAERAASDPEAVTEITVLSARLPLALAVAAARGAARPRLPLATLAAELRGIHSRLDALDTGDPATSVRAVFSWSSQQLSPSSTRLFRLLGLHPGPDITVSAAASLSGTLPAQARRDLAELARVHLLAEHAPGRHEFHDLIRAYAAEQAGTAYDQEARRTAIGRLLDHYLHTARTAALLLSPAREPVALAPPRPGGSPGHLASQQEAMDWFEAEYHVLLSVTDLAADARFDSHAWQLPWAMAEFLDRRGHWHDFAATQRTALAAASRIGDTAGRATASRLLATACFLLADYDQARAHVALCLELSQQAGDHAGEARAHRMLSQVARHHGHYAEALGHAEQALSLFRALGARPGEADALNSVGWYHALLGSYDPGRMFCGQALTLHRELGSRHGEAAAWDSLGYIEHQLGRFTVAALYYQRALSLFLELGDRYNQADTLTRLGDTHHAAGRLQRARNAWHRALSILEDLHHPDVSQIRARLSGNA